MDIPKWRVTESTYVVQKPYLRLRKDSIELPNGTFIEDYYVREGPGYAVIFALTPQDEVVFVRQFKYGSGKIMLELPAGYIDDGEEPARTAVRELAEETGYVVDRPQFVGSFAADPSSSQARMHLYFARNARKEREQNLDVTEDIEVELYPLAAVRALLIEGKVEAIGQVAAIYTVLETVLGPHGLSSKGSE